MLTPGAAAARDALLRCWVRERSIPVPESGELTLPLASGGVAIATVAYRSATGHHRFTDVRLRTDEQGAANRGVPCDTRSPTEVRLPAGEPADVRPTSGEQAVDQRSTGDPVARSADGRHITDGGPADGPASPPGADPSGGLGGGPDVGLGGGPFGGPPGRLDSGLGGWSDSGLGGGADGSPGGGPFGGLGSGPDGGPGSGVAAVTLAAALVGDVDGSADLVARVADSVQRIERYLAVRGAESGAAEADPFLDAEQGLLLGHLLHPAAKSRDGITPSEDTAYAPELRGRFPLHWFAVDPAAAESGVAPGTFLDRSVPELMAELSGVDDGRVLIPAHPWQAADLLRRRQFTELVASGVVTPIGPAGAPWSPTSSLRTVYRSDRSVMLKLSLGLRITNSRRENTHTELVRGLEVHRLLAAGIDAAVRTAYPRFRIVRDPGYLTLRLPDGTPTHLDVSVREAPAGLAAARCLAGLVAPRPGIGPSKLAELVGRIATATHRPVDRVAAEWVRRYVTAVLAPMVLLYASTGIGLEAHQQNTLVLLDDQGWPETGWYRDNQGYYLASSALPAVLRRTGAAGTTLALAPDSIVDERLTYYLLLNQAMAPVAGLGLAGVADEAYLLGALRDGLGDLVERGHDTNGGLVRRWLTEKTLPCKANLATRLAGIDEVLAPVDNQSVYLSIPNPLREAR